MRLSRNAIAQNGTGVRVDMTSTARSTGDNLIDGNTVADVDGAITPANKM